MSLQTVNAPTHTVLKLDTSHIVNATDDAGKPVIHELTGKPVQIAQDTTTGLWYWRHSGGWPKNAKDAAELKDAGALHFAHGRFGGLWVPCDVADDAAGVKPKKAK